VGSLTAHLQERFALACPGGWSCRAEVPLVDPAASRRLGFEPRADLLLERSDGHRRVWVEFEISRADPVANHAKFATSMYFEGNGTSDAFVSMASRHIAPGRAALAAGTAMMMRSLGIPAFQVDLLPGFDSAEIKRLNGLTRDRLAELRPIDVRPELDRVLAVADAVITHGWHRIHKADNRFTVSMSVRRWNAEMADPLLAARWGRRSVQFFVFDPVTASFAPSKFCAFVPAAAGRGRARPFSVLDSAPGGMGTELYVSLGEQDPRFDGNIARLHLAQRLGYRLVKVQDAPAEVSVAFDKWASAHEGSIGIRGSASVLLPPER
jgi:hypothetical protein